MTLIESHIQGKREWFGEETEKLMVFSTGLSAIVGGLTFLLSKNAELTGTLFFYSLITSVGITPLVGRFGLLLNNSAARGKKLKQTV